jgi:hypothetical protein
MRILHSIVLPALLTIVTLGALPTVPSVQLARPMANAMVALDDGTLVFADGFRRVLWRLAPDGTLAPPAAAVDPRYLELDAAGTVHSRSGIGAVMTSTPSGDMLAVHGSTVLRVAADGSTSIVAADEPLLTPRRSVFSRLFGSPRAHLTGIAAGAHGEVYVANTSRGTVVRLDREGGATVADRCEPGWAPVGLASVNGQVFILENGYGARVRRLGDAGRNSIASWVRPPRTSRATDTGARVVL